MAYVVVSDIQSEFKNIVFTSTTSVTDTEVLEFIAQEEALINTMIANRYETPVPVSTVAEHILKQISIAFVSYRVAKIINLKKDVPIPSKLVAQDLSEGATFLKNRILLKEIQNGGLVLTDAVQVSSGQGLESYNATNRVEPIWKRGTKQW